MPWAPPPRPHAFLRSRVTTSPLLVLFVQPPPRRQARSFLGRTPTRTSHVAQIVRSPPSLSHALPGLSGIRDGNSPRAAKRRAALRHLRRQAEALAANGIAERHLRKLLEHGDAGGTCHLIAPIINLLAV